MPAAVRAPPLLSQLFGEGGLEAAALGDVRSEDGAEVARVVGNKLPALKEVLDGLERLDFIVDTLPGSTGFTLPPAQAAPLGSP